jgi:hypothetical protein
MIVVVPHVIRRLDITPENLRTIASGSQAAVKLTHSESAEAPLPGGAPPATSAAIVDAPPATAPPIANAGPQARFSASELTVEPGQPFQVSLFTENGQDVAGAAFTLKWDASLLQLTSASPGALFTHDGHAPAILSNIQNDKGLASIDIGPLAKSVASAKDQSLVTLTFQPLTQGATQLTAPQVQLRDSHGAITALYSSQMSVKVK